MALHKLEAAQIGYPLHPADQAGEGGFFALSSHKRAREALRFGLDMTGIGFNTFVVGDDRSGRMNATRELLEGYVRDRPVQDDWVYLNNFLKSHRPQPYRLPAGAGGRFRERLAAVAVKLATAATKAALAEVDAVIAEFAEATDLAPWFAHWRRDVEAHAGTFPIASDNNLGTPERRYAVNLLVDHGGETCPKVVIEPTPSYRNLFGSIEYVRSANGLTTDFTMIRAGALHRANGGILVLRAEALAKDAGVWEALKGTLRDRKLRIEEPHRSGAVPIASAPRPYSIPFDAKVVIVGAPRWYYGWFLNDPESRVYFKVKADICDDLGATADNIAAYVGLIRRFAAGHDTECDQEAIQLLLGIAARWAEHREKLSSRLELLDDLIGEAALIGRSTADGKRIRRADVAAAAAEQRRRVSQAEDRLYRAITDRAVMVTTTGTAVAQVNALIVFDKVDHRYGSPCRVTARSWIGQLGVINIERDVNLGGPIQHKGVLGLQGYLAGCFARRAPVSFSGSITFEQNYGGIEGDSASLAELLALLSDLSGVPLRQDLAVTGSVNQHGEIQSVSGVNHKIEGFFRTCVEQGGLTGSQGVIIPAANLVNVILDDEVSAAVAAGRFHLWTVSRVDDAVTLFTGQTAGEPDAAGYYPADSVYGRVASRLTEFDRILTIREGERRR
jgi:predicted ATP-dependent protease